MILGIDPGKSGALAIVDGSTVAVHDVPCIGGKPDFTAWAKLWMIHLPWASHVWIEDVHSMPKQGVSSTFDFGRSYGFVIGLVAASGTPYSFVRPQEWRKTAGLVNGAAKGASRLRAKQLWPSVDYFDRAKDDGRAEAALIAFHGANRNGTT
jgi:crossover junction endodeoxyribonuclease RuvC